MSRKNYFRLPLGLLACWMNMTCVFAVGLPSASAAQSLSSPPVILISVDTLRADRLSCYGYRNLRTPNIDAIAQGGTLFSQAGAQVPLTLPSHASFLTSTYPFANGIEDNGQQLAQNAVTLAAVLKPRGYRTAAFVGGFVLDRRFGLNLGFDLYDSPFDLHRGTGQDPGDIKRPGEDVVRAAKQWLDQNSAQPFSFSSTSTICTLRTVCLQGGRSACKDPVMRQRWATWTNCSEASGGISAKEVF